MEEQKEERDKERKGREEKVAERWIAMSKLKTEEEEQSTNKVEKGKRRDEEFVEDIDEDEIAASKFTCFEDLLEAVGSRGWWNICLFILCGSCECCK